MTTQVLHQAQVERCVDNMLGMLNNGVWALMTSIGHRTGLFDTMTIFSPSTSAQIAAAAGLHKRYGSEWLGAIVTAGVVDVDPVSTRFVLPAE
jgi:Rv2258c-like winged HTH domain